MSYTNTTNNRPFSMSTLSISSLYDCSGLKLSLTCQKCSCRSRNWSHKFEIFSCDYETICQLFLFIHLLITDRGQRVMLRLSRPN